MIQRIQSLFLLLAFNLQLAMLFFPVTEYALDGNKILVFNASGFKSESVNIEKLYQTTFIYTFICLAALVPFVTIFLFKRRKLQMRLCIYNIILLVGFQAFLLWFSWNIGHQLGAISNYKITIVFPIVSAILSYLAFQSVRKDERLIRSIDRIR